jgi:hypothetical protein
MPMKKSGYEEESEKTYSKETTEFSRDDYEIFIKKIQKGELQPVAFRKMPIYFLKTDIKLPEKINFFTINSDTKLNEMLGKSQLFNENYDHKFKDTFIAAIAFQPSTISYNIKVSSAYVEKSQLYITYSFIPENEVYYFKTNVLIFEVAKPRVVTTVYFINETERKGAAVPYGRRTQYSPKSIDDMRKNYTGLYEGILVSIIPGSTQLITRLQLLPDFTFVLKQAYPDNENRVFESNGNWAPTEDLSSFVINYDKGERDQMRFFFVNKKEIEQLNANGDRLENMKNILKK